MNMRWHDLCTINELAASFAKREGVEALVLAGSTATGLADEESDYDLYAYTRETVPVEFRAQLLKPRAARLELHNTFWECPMNVWNPTALPLISCTARATPSKRTWKPSLARRGRGRILNVPLPLGVASHAGVRSPGLVPNSPGPA